MSAVKTSPAKKSAPKVDPAVQAIVTANQQWKGDTPDTITGDRAVHLAVTVGFGSLQRLGHKRTDALPSASAIGKVMLDRKFTKGQLSDLITVGQARSSAAAQATVKGAQYALKKLA